MALGDAVDITDNESFPDLSQFHPGPDGELKRFPSEWDLLRNVDAIERYVEKHGYPWADSRNHEVN